MYELNFIHQSIYLKEDNTMDEDIVYVLDALQRTPMGKRIDKYKVVVKCPICGEGNKKHDHGHCYVGLINGKPPLVYHCFIGECSGVVTPNFLRDMDIFDNELEGILNIFNKSHTYLNKEERKIYFVKKKKENIIIPDIPDNDSNRYKLDYLRKRLMVNFSYEHAKMFRCIFSLKDFLEANDISPNVKRYKSFLKVVNNDYLGFLSTQNDYIIFRNTKNNDNLRYLKYDIFNSDNTANIIYTVPGTRCDMFAEEVNLNICEGTFDALGLFCHVLKGNKENNIYAACCGSGYINAIKYFIRLGFIGNLNVNIYSDSDKDPTYYKKTYYEIKPWVNSINIFYNKLSKDYGVPRKDISIERINNSAIFKFKR